MTSIQTRDIPQRSAQAFGLMTLITMSTYELAQITFNTNNKHYPPCSLMAGGKTESLNY